MYNNSARVCNIIFVAAFSLVLPSLILAAPDVRFRFGIVKGVDSQAEDTGKLYYSYFSIPFAEPPVGNLRFKKPVAFTGSGPGVVITSDDFPRACTQQPVPKDGGASEDCLYLNVFTPPVTLQGASSVLVKKVMVWIHGGGFETGQAKGYVPGRLVTDHDVIVVSIQYRLGVLGFLSSGDDVLPGNLGLHDQILALNWVKDNIRQFGGDPDDVTVFGQSAGGASVSLLALSPKAKGLFTKAVMQSGTAFAPWAVVEDPARGFYTLAEALGCLPRFFFPGNRKRYHRYIASCMEGKSATDLNFKPKDDVQENLGKGKSTVMFTPVVDGDILPMRPDSLLQDDLYLKRHGVLDRSYVVGFTNAEGLLVIGHVPGFSDFAFIEQLVQPDNMADIVRSAVRDDFSLVPTQDLLNVGFVDLTSDTGFVISSMKFAQVLSEKAAVYLYLFDHYPEFKDSTFPVQGTSHATDLLYLFDFSQDEAKFLASYANLNNRGYDPVPAAYRGVLTSFAKEANPKYQTNPSLPATAAGSTSVEEWPRYNLSQQQYLAISAKPEMRREIYAQRVALWTDFLPKMARKHSFFKGSSRVAYD